MKRILCILIALCAVTSSFAATTAAMNHKDRNITISKMGIEAVYKLADIEPGFRTMVEQDARRTLVRGDGDLEAVRSWIVPAGTTYQNSGLDRSGVPVKHPTKAKSDVLMWTIRSKSTERTFNIKDVCMNVSGSRAAVPYLSQSSETTWNMAEVDLDLRIIINNNQSLSATANASTGAISITNNFTMASPPLMTGGGGGQNQFVFTRDSRGLFSLGYQIGGGTKISINNANTNLNLNNNNNTNNNLNNNTNNNSNSNANSNSVHVGGGVPEPLPEPNPQLCFWLSQPDSSQQFCWHPLVT